MKARTKIMKKKISGVYVIKCIANGRIYIGSSKDIARRWSCHISLLKNGKHSNKEMQEDFNKYGWDRFSFRIKDECLQKDLYEEEDKYIKRYTDDILYNRKSVVNKTKKIRRGKEAAKYRDMWSAKNTGEANPHCTKLTVEKVKEIKQLLKDGVGYQEIADLYDTTYGYISSIKNGYKWSSVKID